MGFLQNYLGLEPAYKDDGPPPLGNRALTGSDPGTKARIPEADACLRRTDRGDCQTRQIIGRYLIEADIRPILSATVVFRNATRRNLRIKTGGARS
jgi:hypothetical protein